MGAIFDGVERPKHETSILEKRDYFGPARRESRIVEVAPLLCLERPRLQDGLTRAGTPECTCVVRQSEESRLLSIGVSRPYLHLVVQVELYLLELFPVQRIDDSLMLVF